MLDEIKQRHNDVVKAKQALKEAQDIFIRKHALYKVGDALVHVSHNPGNELWPTETTTEHFIVVDHRFNMEQLRLYYVYAVFTKGFERQSKKQPYLYSYHFELFDQHETITKMYTYTQDELKVMIPCLDLHLEEFHARMEKHEKFSVWNQCSIKLRTALEDGQ